MNTVAPLSLTGPDPDAFPPRTIGGIMRHGRCHAPAKDYLRRNALVWRARSPDLLRGLSLQPFVCDQPESMARRCPAVRYRPPVHLSGLRQEGRRRRPDFHWNGKPVPAMGYR